MHQRETVAYTCRPTVLTQPQLSGRDTCAKIASAFLARAKIQSLGSFDFLRARVEILRADLGETGPQELWLLP